MPRTPATAALIALVTLQGLMLFSLYTKTAPHPPEIIPLGGMAPFLSMAISAALAALILDPESRAGTSLAVLAALAAAVSFGPQKFADPAFALVFPAVLTGQVAILTLLLHAGARILPPRTL